MNEKLSYEEWKEKFASVVMSQEERELIKTLHGIDNLVETSKRLIEPSMTFISTEGIVNELYRYE